MRRLVAVAAVAAVAGCGGGGDGDGTEARIRLVVPDNNIREEGVECAGARPFRQIHRGTPYSILDADGEVVAEGELPAGRAENADPSVDWESDRFPTVCVMELDVALPERPRYRLVLPESAPLELDAALLERDAPVQLVLRG
jgi:hypothetical protein